MDTELKVRLFFVLVASLALTSVGCTIVTGDEFAETTLLPGSNEPVLFDLDQDEAYVRMARRSSHRFEIDSRFVLDDALSEDPDVAEITVIERNEVLTSVTVRCVRAGSTEVTILASRADRPDEELTALAQVVCVEPTIVSEFLESEGTRYTFSGEYEFSFELVDSAGEPLAGISFPIFDGPLELRNLTHVVDEQGGAASHRRARVAVDSSVNAGQIVVDGRQVEIARVEADEINDARLVDLDDPQIEDEAGGYEVEEFAELYLRVQKNGHDVEHVRFEELISVTPQVCDAAVISFGTISLPVVSALASGQCQIEYRVEGASTTRSALFDLNVLPGS